VSDTGRLLTADVRGRADIYGVHGAAGLTHWKCLAGRRDLRGGWEAVEWASIPPGGLSGEHRHTRTEELYLVLDGAGEFLVDGVRHPATPGRLLLTGLGAVHGLRNVGDRPLNWLVIEMPAPGARAAAVRREEDKMRTALYDLRAERSVDPRSVFDGPLRTIEIDTLTGGARRTLTAEDAEHTVFVLSGSGRALSGGTTVELAPGCSVTVPFRGTVDVTAGPEGLEYFHAEVAVPERVLR
jgi:mannose-6-phosphate isomerase-like protein (cupin superfamily)